MPWSFIDKIPEIMQNTKNQEKIKIEDMETLIIALTGVYNEKKLKEYIKILVRLKYFDIYYGTLTNLHYKAKEEK
jgi:hypothetical protein